MDDTGARRGDESRKLRQPAPTSAELSPEQRRVLKNIETKAIDHAERALVNPADVGEIVQKTAWAMWKKLKADSRLWGDDAEDQRDSLQFKITVDAVADLRRYEEKARSREPEEAVDLDSMPSTMRSQHAHLEEKEFFHTLAHALDTLAPRARLIWCLRHLSEMTVPEIADETGNDEEAISPSLYKSKIALRPLLRADGYDYPQGTES